VYKRSFVVGPWSLAKRERRIVLHENACTAPKGEVIEELYGTLVKACLDTSIATTLDAKFAAVDEK